MLGSKMGEPTWEVKMARLMPRMAEAVPYLGYIMVAGTKSN